MEQLKAFLLSEDMDVLYEDDQTLFWVDWREEDDAIVEYCENQLHTGQLSTEFLKAENDLGYELYIHFGNKKERVPFQPNAVSRDATLITLNHILAPDYEVRLWLDSVGGDTLAFVALTASNWQQLEKEFGLEKVQYHFAPIHANSKLFDMSMKEINRIMNERRK